MEHVWNNQVKHVRLYLVGDFNPSEKYESQLGWWHFHTFPIYGKYKSCSKPPTRYSMIKKKTTFMSKVFGDTQKIKCGMMQVASWRWQQSAKKCGCVIFSMETHGHVLEVFIHNFCTNPNIIPQDGSKKSSSMMTHDYLYDIFNFCQSTYPDLRIIVLNMVVSP